MPPKPDDLKKEDIAGIIIGVVLGSVLLIALFIFIHQRRREQKLRSQIEKAATFTAAAYRTKSIGTSDGTEEESAISPRPSDNSPNSAISRFSEAPDSAITELNPYNYRMRPELATIKSSSRVELFPDEKTMGATGPHELEAGLVQVPRSVKVADHVQGENDSEAGSPVVEMKEVKI